MNNSDVIIIGGGTGGLFTGAFLAKNGMKVTVLEKNSIIGGGLQCFRRGSKIYETGMHVMGGFEPGGNLYKICRYLGILDKLEIQHVDSSCMDEIWYCNPDERYRIPSGRGRFTEYLVKTFPNEESGIRAYVDEIFRLTEEMPLFYMREEPNGIQIHSERFSMAADQLIAEHVSDPKLREILAYLNPLYAGMAGHTPAYVHALINVLYINGASRFIGGSQQLADALKCVIEHNGGHVAAACEVTAIDVEDKSITKVHTDRGETFSAKWYISAVHPVTLLNLLPQATFQRGFVNRLNEIPNSYSAFSLYIDLKPGMFPYIDHTCYYMDDYGAMWNQDCCDPTNWPTGFMYMTPPDPDQGEFANRLLVHCIMSYGRVSRWAETTVGRRGEEYDRWKAEQVEKIIKKLEKIFPDFRNMAEHVYAASPLTIRDYYHTRNGAMFGYRKDCGNLIFSQLSVYTKVRNLLLTGQNINLHGICGVPLTAINTADAILGLNFLVKEIEKFNETESE